ncbi:hypothetical protein KQI63_09815 [bacterium]|nr:hypothetical protein [bacterium]
MEHELFKYIKRCTFQFEKRGAWMAVIGDSGDRAEQGYVLHHLAHLYGEWSFASRPDGTPVLTLPIRDVHTLTDWGLSSKKRDAEEVSA